MPIKVENSSTAVIFYHKGKVYKFGICDTWDWLCRRCLNQGITSAMKTSFQYKYGFFKRLLGAPREADIWIRCPHCGAAERIGEEGRRLHA